MQYDSTAVQKPITTFTRVPHLEDLSAEEEREHEDTEGQADHVPVLLVPAAHREEARRQGDA